MNALLKIDFDKQTISARELHRKLNIATRFNDWFPRMCDSTCLLWMLVSEYPAKN